MENEKTEAELLREAQLEEQYKELLAKSPKRVVEEIKAIETGERLPELYSDYAFKKQFDADVHRDRLTKLLQMIFGFSLEVVSSLKNEAVLTTIYSKKSILDILAKLSNNAVSNIEMQVVAQEFITKRIDVYCSDVILMQYSVQEGQKKEGFDFNKIEKTYVAVLMKESPKLFRDNKSYIHRKLSITDTGIELPSLEEVVYLELDKCLEQFKEGKIAASQEELATWLSAIAEVNDSFVRDKMSGLKDMADIQNDLKNMRLNKEEMVAMLGEKYEQAVRYSELNEAKRKGEEIGEIRGIAIGEARGIEIGKVQGEANLKKLMALLLRDNRNDDLAKAMSDDAFCMEMYKEYGIDK